MSNKLTTFIQNLGFLFVQRGTRVFSLFMLFFDLVFKDWKSASSIFFFSIESLASVFRYNNEGKKTLDLQTEKNKVLASKKSLFILGSGPSVNDYTGLEWDIIKKNDSWGFNLWFCHEFIPSIYIAQSLIEPNLNKKSTREYNTNVILRKMLEDKKDLYSETEFYIRGDAVNKRKFYQTEFGSHLEIILGRQGNLFAEMPISSTNRIRPEILLERIFKRGFFKINRKIQIVPKFGSTITEMISLALMLGYKEIVLCGIDMNNGGHFYDNEESFKNYPYLKELSSINHNRTIKGGHEHMDTSTRPFTIKDYIIALKNFAEMKFDAKILVMNETSTLYPDIQKYERDV